MQYLLAGLGNPGSQYAYTRHNAGFRIVDAVASKWGAEWKPWQTLGEYAKVNVGGNEIFLLKPTTYMNESGRAVSSLARFYKIPPKNCVICFDEVSLNTGKLRFRKNGSAGGQNGMKSVIAQMGTQDIPRLRMGIGPKPGPFDLADFVLSKFTPEQEKLIEQAAVKAAEVLEIYFTQGMDRAMNACNQ